MDAIMDFYDRTMAIASFSGVGRLPEISVPLRSNAKCPIGLSLAAGYYQDEFLLDVVRERFTDQSV
jgi:amidase